MIYALIEDNIVVNVIWLSPTNADEFPNAVDVGDYSVDIGDSYIDGIFYRNGKRILTTIERLENDILEKDMVIAELDAALLDATYENIVGGLE